MGLIDEEVEVTLNGGNITYFENLGYKIPKFYDYRKKKNVVKRGTKIYVKIKDLTKGSTVKVKVKCDNPNCKKDAYEILYSDYVNYNHDGKYYCNDCAKKLFNSGINNPRWKSEKTDEEREIGRAYPGYKQFIKKVLARDNYICKCCNNKDSSNLEVHHLDGYDWCKDKRTDETNGITLCHNCHRNFHNIYGLGGNTREQFEEWLGQAINELEKYDGELSATKKIYCIEEDKIYDSAEQLSSEWHASKTSIYDVCNHKKQTETAYCKSLKGKHLLWLDEYNKMNKEDIKKYLEWCEPKNDNYRLKSRYHPRAKKVICITTGKIFNTVKEASEYYNIKAKSHISACCKGTRNYCGKLPDGTKLQWEYYEDAE